MARQKFSGEKELFHNAAKNNDIQLLKKLIDNGFRSISCENEHDFNRTPLHKAAQNGHKNVVEYLISQGAEVNTTDKFGKTPLHFATGEESKDGELEIVKLLVETGAQIDKKDNFGMTPALIASIRGHENLVNYFKNSVENEACKPNRELFNKTLEVLEKNEKKFNHDMIEKEPKSKQIKRQKLFGDKDIFHNAAKNDDIPTLKKMMADGFKYINCEDEHDFNRTALHKAAQNGHKDVVEYLVSHEADVNATDMFGKMPIHFAAGEESKSGNLEIVKLLLEKGARLDKKDIYGNTPLLIASIRGHEKLVKYFQNHALEMANSKSEMLSIEKSLDIPTEQQVLDKIGESENNIDEMILIDEIHKIWLDEDLEKIDKNIEKNPQSKRIEYLNGDKEIFHNAAKNGTLHTLKQLIVEEDFKYINCQDKLAYNRTPLHKAVNHKHIHQKFEKVVQYLLDQGADVNAKDTFGRTPTHIAVLMGQSEIVKILVEKGARLDVKDVFGNNTLQCASKSGYTYIAKYLKEIMENPNPTFERNLGIVTKKLKISEMSETLKKDNERFEKIVKQSGKRKTEANVDIAKPKRQNIVVDLDKTEKGIDEKLVDEDLEIIDKESKTKQLKSEPSNEISDDEISTAKKVDHPDDCQNSSYNEIQIQLDNTFFETIV